jgi:hypothetical protein
MDLLMTTADPPKLSKTQYAALTRATRHGFFRVASVWRAKSVRKTVSVATIDALVKQGCLRLDGETATLTDRGRDALKRTADWTRVTPLNGASSTSPVHVTEHSD